LFCKNIRWFENFTLLTTIRRSPWRPSWPGPWRFQDLPPWPTAIQMSPVGPHGRGGQPLRATAVTVKPSCATVASQTAVAHGGTAHPAVVAYSGKFPPLYIGRKLARKCYKNSKSVGKERGGEWGGGVAKLSGSSLRCKYFVDLKSFSSYLETVFSDLLCFFRSVVLKKFLFVGFGLRRRRGEVEGAE
jgi:hypothetical protein